MTCLIGRTLQSVILPSPSRGHVNGSDQRSAPGRNKATSPHDHAATSVVLLHGMADRAHAFPLLVEYVVWAAPLGQTNQRIPARRKTSPPYPTCSDSNWRAHSQERTWSRP